jgi:ketosteroid isomerase-like protein
MSQENVEIVRKALARFTGRDYEGVLDLVAEDAVWEPSGMFVGSGEPFTGHAAIRQFWAAFTEPWDTITLEAVGAEELDDARVLTDTLFQGIGRGSAVPTEMHVIQLWTIRDGEITRLQNFANRSEALEAAELWE